MVFRETAEHDEVERRPSPSGALGEVTALPGLTGSGRAFFPEIYIDHFTIGWLDEDLFAIIDVNGTIGRNPIC